MLAFISINACIIQKKVVPLYHRNKDNNNIKTQVPEGHQDYEDSEFESQQEDGSNNRSYGKEVGQTQS